MKTVEGGAFGGIEDLYREVIIEHFKAPKNKGRLETPNAESEGLNPLCGDHVVLTARVEGNVLTDLKFSGSGCAISQSSASMMTESIKGKSLPEAKSFIQHFKSIFGIREKENVPTQKFTQDDLGDLEALEGVKKYPVRVKCAVLCWNTLLELIKNHEKKEQKNP